MLPPVCEDNFTLLLLSSPLLPVRVRRFPFTAEGAVVRASEVEIDAGSPAAGWITCADVDASALDASGIGVEGPESPEVGVGTGEELLGELRLILARRWAVHKPCIERLSAFEPYLSACKRYTRSCSATTYRDLHIQSACSLSVT